MRKFVLFVLVFALCVCMLASCGDKTNDEKNTKESTRVTDTAEQKTDAETTVAEVVTEAPQTPNQDWTNFY